MIPLPDGAGGEWRERRWNNDDTPRELERASLRVDPPTAFRSLRVYRMTGELLANEAWDPSRTRALRILPENTHVAPCEPLLLRGMAWADDVTLTVVLTWKGE